ncbi:DNA ligase [Dirofilaria immitis]
MKQTMLTEEEAIIHGSSPPISSAVTAAAAADAAKLPFCYPRLLLRSDLSISRPSIVSGVQVEENESHSLCSLFHFIDPYPHYTLPISAYLTLRIIDWFDTLDASLPISFIDRFIH